ncbi:MAG: hypothetical protein L6437_10035 [Kiritimatiellae bacterium]|nr:hypothetical protein [Kiritimatiellia bacterium]
MVNSISTVSATAVYGWAFWGCMLMATDFDGDGLADPAVRSATGNG